MSSFESWPTRANRHATDRLREQMSADVGKTDGQMETLEEIEQAVCSLTPEELVLFRAWFAEFGSVAWDTQVERDCAAGKLDALVEAALRVKNHPEE